MQVVSTTGGTWTANYTYDSAGRLKQANAGNLHTSYSYDGFNNRISQTNTVSGTTTNYLVDPSGSLPQLLGEFPSGKGSPTYYIPGLGQDAAGAMSYFNTDGLGSVRQMTNGTGNLTFAANFDPYGGILNANVLPGSTNLGYTGAPSDPTGLIYLNARFYNPSIGSFQTHDPLEGDPGSPASFNGYAYAGSNPVTYADPSGKCIGPLVIVCLAVIVGGLSFINDWRAQVYHNETIGLTGWRSVAANNLDWNSLDNSFTNAAGDTLAVGGLVAGGIGFVGAIGTYGVVGALGLTANTIGIGLAGGAVDYENNSASINEELNAAGNVINESSQSVELASSTRPGPISNATFVFLEPNQDISSMFEQSGYDQTLEGFEEFERSQVWGVKMQGTSNRVYTGQVEIGAAFDSETGGLLAAKSGYNNGLNLGLNLGVSDLPAGSTLTHVHPGSIIELSEEDVITTFSNAFSEIRAVGTNYTLSWKQDWNAALDLRIPGPEQPDFAQQIWNQTNEAQVALRIGNQLGSITSTINYFTSQGVNLTHEFTVSLIPFGGN